MRIPLLPAALAAAALAAGPIGCTPPEDSAPATEAVAKSVPAPPAGWDDASDSPPVPAGDPVPDGWPVPSEDDGSHVRVEAAAFTRRLAAEAERTRPRRSDRPAFDDADYQPMLVLPPESGVLVVSDGRPGALRAMCGVEERKPPVGRTTLGHVTPVGDGAPQVYGVVGDRRTDLGPLGGAGANEHVLLCGVDFDPDWVADYLELVETGLFTERQLLDAVAEEGPLGSHRRVAVRVAKTAAGFDYYVVVFGGAVVAEPAAGAANGTPLNDPATVAVLIGEYTTRGNDADGDLQDRLWAAGRLAAAVNGLGLTLDRGDGGAVSIDEDTLRVPTWETLLDDEFVRAAEVVFAIDAAVEAGGDTPAERRRFRSRLLDRLRPIENLTGLGVLFAAAAIDAGDVDD